MIIIKRRNQFNKSIIDINPFFLYKSAIKYLKSFSETNNILLEIKIIDGDKSSNDKQCFNKYNDAIKFLKQKNGEN
jgi:hypothetical protein